MSPAGPWVVPTAGCQPAHVGDVGGKAVGLGRLHQAGQRVPDSFVVTTAAYRAFVAGGDPDAALPGPVDEAIRSAYASLGVAGSPATVAVRSSATVEDSDAASCAGQFTTSLGVRGADEVVAHVRRCFLSVLEPHVDSYRASRGVATDGDGVAVVVQQLVDARAAGVLFTRHPRTGDKSLVVVEASHGLGEAVVGGAVHPDLFEVNRVTGQIHSRTLGTKATEHRLAPDGRSVAVLPVEAERAAAWSIDEDEVRSLVAVGLDLEGRIGPGLDIEWAIGPVAGTGGDEELFVLQVRPITVGAAGGAGRVGGGLGAGRLKGGLAGSAGRPEASGSKATAGASSPIDAVLGRLSGRPSRKAAG